MTAAVYPIKRIDWEKVAALAQAGRAPLHKAALSYMVEFVDSGPIETRNGFAKVGYAGTGFLMIRRAVLERMCAHYPQLRFARDHSADAATASPNRYALFDCMIDEKGTYLSEDFAFCRRWTDMGGEIWADLSSRLEHVGPMTFSGDLSSQFAAVSGDRTSQPAAA